MTGPETDTRLNLAVTSAHLVWHSGQTNLMTCRGCTAHADMAHVVTAPNFVAGGPEAAYFRCPACGTLNCRVDSFADYGSQAELLASAMSTRHYIEVGAGIDSMIRPLVSAVPQIAGRSLLDVGCGFGFGVRYWNWAGGDAHGADPAAYGELGSRILDDRIVPRYLYDAPELNERHYDLVYASEVIEHVDDVAGFVRSLKAVTKPGGVLALTTPNGDYVAADKPISAMIAALSPGVHRLLFSLGALEAVLREAGFRYVRAHTGNEQLIAYASDAPLAEGHDIDRSTYIRFLVETARSRDDPHLKMGLLYRAFKEQMNAGERASAEVSFTALRELVQESFGLDLLDPSAVLARVSEAATFDGFRDRAPFFAPALLYYVAMARLNWGLFLDDAAAGFAACAAAARHCDRIAPSMFRESSGLYWSAILHEGIARLREGDYVAAASTLRRFFLPQTDAPEAPDPELVSRARRELDLVEQQTGHPENSTDAFSQAIQITDSPSTADVLEPCSVAPQTADPVMMHAQFDKTDHVVLVDICAKFFRYLRIEGWVCSDFTADAPQDRIARIVLKSAKVASFDGQINLPSPGLGDKLNKSFIIDVQLTAEEFPEDAVLRIEMETGALIERNLVEICNDRIARYESLSTIRKFRALIGDGSVVDIGGRSRSQLDRSALWQNEICVFDVLDGDNVDVVGDAHHLSDYFGPGTFDAAMSIFVFEHLAMPWKVVGEINRVVRTGGYIVVYTHQTIGLHDSPWDFFRFSEDTWPVLFNAKTGFRIIERGSDFEQFVIPFVYHVAKKDAEKSAGREASWVIAQKTADVCLEYPLRISDFTETLYPDTEDGNDPDTLLLR